MTTAIFFNYYFNLFESAENIASNVFADEKSIFYVDIFQIYAERAFANKTFAVFN